MIVTPQAAITDPDKLAVVNCDDSDPAAYTYRTLYDRTLRLASVFRRCGVAPGGSVVRPCKC